MRRLLTLLLLVGPYFGAMAQQTQVQQIGEDIQLIRLTENTFIHRSFKLSEENGRVPSNGLVYIVDSTCVILDMPTTSKATVRLLDYLTKEKGVQVQALVVNHFQEDAGARLDSVQARGVLTYSSRKTAVLFKKAGATVADKKFRKKKVIKLGDQELVNYAPGPGYTVDNIVSYLPAEQVLFGGSLVKAYGVGRGNTADAVLTKWSDTIAKVQKKFPNTVHVVPGRGHSGGPELLSYTAGLFAGQKK